MTWMRVSPTLWIQLISNCMVSSWHHMQFLSSAQGSLIWRVWEPGLSGWKPEHPTWALDYG